MEGALLMFGLVDSIAIVAFLYYYITDKKEKKTKAEQR